MFGRKFHFRNIIPNMTHKTSQEHVREREKSKEPTNDQLLHSIAKIIRNDIAKVEFSTEHDPTSAGASPVVLHFLLT
jgi:hypothetical protein